MDIQQNQMNTGKNLVSSNYAAQANYEYAELFTKKLSQAMIHNAVAASEYSHKSNLKEKKDHIEDGKYLDEESDDDLLFEEHRLKRKLHNIILRQQKKLGI